MNIVFLSGRLVSNPNVRTVGKNNLKIAEVSVEVEGVPIQGKSPTKDSFNLIFWAKKAELVYKHFSQGATLSVRGKLKQDQWIDKQTNQEKTGKLSVVVEEILNLPALQNATVGVSDEEAVESEEFTF